MKTRIAAAVALVGMIASGVALAEGSQILDLCGQSVKAMGNSQTTSSQITTVISVVGSVVGLVALTVAWSQMRIASAKVKLDLYNKRFNVYLATLEYYQSAYGKVEGSMRAKSVEFVKCYRESQFLFNKKHGIYDTLSRIMASGNQILVYEDAISGAKSNISPETKKILLENSVGARLNFEVDLQVLEKQIARYINFRVVRGWTLWL